MTTFPPPSPMTFERLMARDYKFLYAGDIPVAPEYNFKEIIGLSLHRHDARHIRHDVTVPYPLPDGVIDAYQAEDVFEHIQYDALVPIINEIHRILKPGGYFRLSVPDYRCDIIYERSFKDANGRIVFDPGGGGGFYNGIVVNGGHVWFPIYEQVRWLIERSRFDKYEFFHYYDEDGHSVTKPIDYTRGYVQRTPDFDPRVHTPYRAMSIVVDMFK